jgi:polysaccharide export outer membrane protein
MMNSMEFKQIVASVCLTTRLNDVVICRTVAGQCYTALYNLDAIRPGAYPDADDVVMVGDSRSRRMFKDVLTTIPALVTPVIIGIDHILN